MLLDKKVRFDEATVVTLQLQLDVLKKDNESMREQLSYLVAFAQQMGLLEMVGNGMPLTQIPEVVQKETA